MSELDDAPEHVKLAVDLIMLLEQNEIAANVAVQALEIVLNDCKAKLTKPIKSQSVANAND